MKELNDSQLQRDDAFQEFTPAIRAALDSKGVNYEIKARIKSPYSIWQKMQRKHIPFEEVFDILAIRIIFRPKNRENEVAECYEIYAALTQIYKPHPSRFRDWLPRRKPTAIKRCTTPSCRTKASGSKCKSAPIAWTMWPKEDLLRTGSTKRRACNTMSMNWIRGSTPLRKFSTTPSPDTLDLLDTIKLNLFASELNVFTPKGEIVTLPQGSDGARLRFRHSLHWWEVTAWARK